MANQKLKIRRGLKENLPILDIGELGFCTDTEELFIGTLTGNVLVGKDLQPILDQLSILSRLGITSDGNLTIDGVVKTGLVQPGNTDVTPPILTISPTGGTFTSSQTITMSTNETANIYYTLNNSTPTINSTKYTSPITIAASSTLKAFAIDSSNNASSIQTVSYTISPAIDTTPPNDITNLAANNITQTGLTLNWTASTSSDISGYEIYNGSTLLNTISTNSYNVSGLIASTSYTFKVIAKDSSGNKSAGITINVTTLANQTVDTTPPNDVTNLTASNIAQTSITINWTASTSSDVSSYDIYNGNTLLGNTTLTTYNISGLAASTTYTLWVKAKDSSNNVSNGLSLSVTTLATQDITPPNPVTNLTSSNISTTSVTLSWNNSTSTDVSNYEIYNGVTLLASTSSNSYTITGLTASTNYTLTVKVRDTSNNLSSGVDITFNTVADTTPPVISISPTSGSFSGNIYVSLYSNETATIYYSLDGSNPSLIYSSPIQISASTTVKYYGVDSSNNASTIQSSIYTLDNTITTSSGVDGGTFTDNSTTIVDSGTFTSTDTTTVDGGTFADITAPNNVVFLSSTNVTATSLTLNWNPSTSTDIASYDVYQGNTLLGNTINTTYNVSGLSEKTSYTFTIKAKDTTGNISSGSTATFTTADVTAPNDVTSLSASNVLLTSLNLTWTASSSTDVDSYDVYQDNVLLGNTKNTSYSVSGLTQTTTYTFVVKAKDASGNTSAGASLTITTAAPDTTAPDEVTNLTVDSNSLTTSSATLNWTASISTDILQYDIYNGATLLGSVTNTTYTATGLSSGTSYTFTVKSKDISGNVSNGVSVTFTTTIPDTTPPSEVTNLATSNVKDTTLTLTWTASVSTDITSYDVYNGSTKLGNTTSTTYNITGLTANTAYTFWVKSIDKSGNISTGASIQVTTAQDTTPPNNVTTLATANLKDVSVTLTWQNPTNADFNGCNIYNGATLLGSTTKTSTMYAVTGLTKNTQYTFWVKAKDTTGNEASGTSITVTTTADTYAPAEVTNYGAKNITTNSLTLSWKASSSTDISTYNIYDSTNTLLTTTSNNYYDISGLTADTAYSYTIKSTDTTGNTSAGVTFTVYTLASDIVWTKTYNANTENVTIDLSTNFSSLTNVYNNSSNYDNIQTDSNGIKYNKISSPTGIAIKTGTSNFALSFKGTIGNQLNSVVPGILLTNGTVSGIVSPGNFASNYDGNFLQQYRIEYRNGTIKAFIDGKQLITPSSNVTFNSTNIGAYNQLMNVIGTIDNTKNYAILGLNDTSPGNIYEIKYGEW